jgi:hypothetical protein
MALPLDWLEPMQRPAKAAAHQNISLLVLKAAKIQVKPQPHRVIEKSNGRLIETFTKPKHLAQTLSNRYRIYL